tara:strand:- start:1301 stop:2266 length:966 start_codon:yes stop_codon:yes gene_type:complete
MILQVNQIEQIGKRLDHYLVNQLAKYSRSRVQSFIRSGQVLVNGNKCKTGYSLEMNDIIQVDVPKQESNFKKLIPENLNLNIIHEDESIIVINKPAGIIVHPGIGVNSGTVANGLAYHFRKLSNINGDLRPGVVHRLDKDTSGVMIIAKTNSAHAFLADQFKERKVKKKYIGLTWGVWDNEKGEINKPLLRDKKDPTKYSIGVNGKNSITKYEVQKLFRHSSLVSFFPLTGRTHQIRVHGSYYGHPIFGDEKYGGGVSRSKGFLPEFKSHYKRMIDKFNRHALHAEKLELIHPISKEIVKFDAPLPKEYLDLVKSIDLLNE